MPDSKPVVLTTTGPVRGRASAAGTPVRFLGIPYAQPPLGARRFMPPEPVEPWDQVLEALEFGPAAAQVYDPHETGLEDFGVVPPADGSLPHWVGDEDCLTLNVWTPGLGRPLRPVLVWVHGGANWLESSRLGSYDGAALAERGNTVVVSFNYRLGIFGFLDLSVTGGERYLGSHSNGLRDQLLALRWIRDNITSFGGDPQRITLAGESAGSMNISWLATTGELRGLVQRVVLMSGVASMIGFGHDHAQSGHSEVEGRRRAGAFLSELGIHSMEQLAATPTSELLAGHASMARHCDVLFDLDTLFYPRVDGRFTRMTPFEAAERGLFDGLEVMIGFTAYEMGLWLAWDPMLDRGEPEAMVARLRNFPEASRAPIAAFYDHLYAWEPAGVRAMHLLADACFVMPSVLLAELLVRRSTSVWMYQFDWTAGDTRRRALHAADQGFFFGTLDSSGARMISGVPRDHADAEERMHLSLTMQDALLSFVASGDPQGAGTEPWRRYATERNVMHLNAPACRLKRGEFEQRWCWWHENVFEPVLSHQVS